ncbi:MULTISPECIES: hypothetical protein [unclassified Mesorhizobium]|uniref:hypothetical protein n=1 Tax=unclassified Mesorhizobium TaxID=325217 RepID=UPI00333CD930
MMTLKKMVFGGSVCAAAVLALSMSAEAKRARCFTSDDGYFSCNYRALDGDGSFRISAPGYPTYVLEVDGPGFAYGYVNLGRRNVSLPGQFVRAATMTAPAGTIRRPIPSSAPGKDPFQGLDLSRHKLARCKRGCAELFAAST